MMRRVEYTYGIIFCVKFKKIIYWEVFYDTKILGERLFCPRLKWLHGIKPSNTEQRARRQQYSRISEIVAKMYRIPISDRPKSVRMIAETLALKKFIEYQITMEKLGNSESLWQACGSTSFKVNNKLVKHSFLTLLQTPQSHFFLFLRLKLSTKRISFWQSGKLAKKCI